MSGEMTRSEVTEEAYPLHFYVARHLRGTVEPFDQYQGPCIRTKYHNLWLCEVCDGDSFLYWYESSYDMQSYEFDDPSFYRNGYKDRKRKEALYAAIRLIHRCQDKRKLTNLVSLEESR